MATRIDPDKTLLAQGKFIDIQQRHAIEARARALRAEAIRALLRTAGSRMLTLLRERHATDASAPAAPSRVPLPWRAFGA